MRINFEILSRPYKTEDGKVVLKRFLKMDNLDNDKGLEVPISDNCDISKLCQDLTDFCKSDANDEQYDISFLADMFGEIKL